jgi:hypothetical protein
MKSMNGYRFIILAISIIGIVINLIFLMNLIKGYGIPPKNSTGEILIYTALSVFLYIIINIIYMIIEITKKSSQLNNKISITKKEIELIKLQKELEELKK